MALFSGAAVRGRRRARLARFLAALVLLIVVRLVVETRHGDALDDDALDEGGDGGAAAAATAASEEEEVGADLEGSGTPIRASPGAPRSKVAFLFLTARTVPQHPIWTKFFEVGLYKLNAGDPQLGSAWFQLLRLMNEMCDDILPGASLLSAFKCNVYRYVEGADARLFSVYVNASPVGRRKLNSVAPALESDWFQTLTLEYQSWFQNVPFKCDPRRYTPGAGPQRGVFAGKEVGDPVGLYKLNPVDP
jgi:hypothetical protein